MKFKIGDRVRVKDKLDGKSLAGKIGTIVRIDPSDSYSYGVEFDEPFVGEHNCGGYAKSGHGRYGYESELELVNFKFKVGDKVIAQTNAPYAFTTNGWTGVVTQVNGENVIRVRNGDGPNFDVNPKYFDLVSESSNKVVITREGRTVLARLYDGKKVIKSAEAKCSPHDTFDFAIGAKLALERLSGGEINRVANVGEYVRVLSEGGHTAKKDAVVKVTRVYSDGWVAVDNNGKSTTLRREQYIVVVGYEPAPEPKPYNGKVVCIDLNGHNSGIYTVGKIYQFKDGVLIADDGVRIHGYYKSIMSFEEWQDFSSSKWLEVKE